MATETLRIQVRADTAANWTSNNTVLLAGEEGIETDTRRRKIGDGSTGWTLLPYTDSIIQVKAQTGTSYTLIVGDAGKKITMSNGAANTLTIPTNASAAIPVGTVIGVTNIGAGTTTIEGATGVTLNGVSAGSGDIISRYSGVTLTKLGTDTWIAEGNIGTVE